MTKNITLTLTPEQHRALCIATRQAILRADDSIEVMGRDPKRWPKRLSGRIAHRANLKSIELLLDSGE